MAYLRTRANGAIEIRESVTTEKGPRAVTLASFRGALGPGVLDRAAERARGAFDRARVIERARELGLAVRGRPRDRSARQLLKRLRAGARVDPVLVTLLRDALANLPAAPVPEQHAELAEWLCVSHERRGDALRGLLRTYDRIVSSRPPRAQRAAELAFPKFASAPER
jgi:hypothetical protein